MLKAVVVLFLLQNYIGIASGLHCYSCIVPEDVTSFSRYCNKDNYCTGKYCYKGMNELNSGYLLSCIDAPPIDSKAAVCQTAYSSRTRTNCYCKNNHFCNSSPSHYQASFIILFILFLINIIY